MLCTQTEARSAAAVLRKQARLPRRAADRHPKPHALITQLHCQDGPSQLELARLTTQKAAVEVSGGKDDHSPQGLERPLKPQMQNIGSAVPSQRILQGHILIQLKLGSAKVGRIDLSQRVQEVDILAATSLAMPSLKQKFFSPNSLLRGKLSRKRDANLRREPLHRAMSLTQLASDAIAQLQNMCLNITRLTQGEAWATIVTAWHHRVQITYLHGLPPRWVQPLLLMMTAVHTSHQCLSLAATLRIRTHGIAANQQKASQHQQDAIQSANVPPQLEGELSQLHCGTSRPDLSAHFSAATRGFHNLATFVLKLELGPIGPVRDRCRIIAHGGQVDRNGF